MRLYFFGLLFVVVSETAGSQTFVVQRNTNLRTGPSTAYDVLELLHSGDTVTRIEPQNIGGYIQVRHATIDGWLWKPNVHEVSEPTVSQPEVVSALPPAPAHHKACPLGGKPGGSLRQSRTDSLKNRTADVTDSEIDPSVTLAALLQTGDDTNRFDEASGGEIIAYVDTVKVGGEETVNCGSSFPEDYDTHIEVSLTTNAASTKRVIVEITPAIREVARQRGLDWTTNALRNEILHKWIRVRGWMLWDWHHTGQAKNTKPNGAHDWRATAWEIHPITSLRVCTNGPANCD